MMRPLTPILLAIFCAGIAAADDVTRLEIIDARQVTRPVICCLSGVDTDAGGRVVLVSDRGFRFDAGLDSEMSSLIITQSLNLSETGGTPTSLDWIDAEGLAVANDGRIFISFERQHRITEYQATRALSSWAAPDFITLPSNGGMEALALDVSGTLWALPETPVEGSFALLALADGVWERRGLLEQTDGYLPVGADFDAIGRLYVLERDRWLLSFRSRVRRINNPMASSLDIETLWESDYGEYDNLEGIAVLDGDRHSPRLLLISDDNQRSFQETQAIIVHLD